MLRIAVLVAGMFREFETAYPSWEFMSDPDMEVDLYFVSIDKTLEINASLGINLCEDVTLDRVYSVCPSAFKVIIEKDDILLEGKNSSVKMIYRWHRVINLMRDSQKDYDIVILTRPDVYIGYDKNKLLKQIASLDDNTICTPGGVYRYFNTAYKEERIGINDLFALGKPKAIFKILEVDYNALFSDVHYYLYERFTALAEVVSISGLHSIFIIRSNARNLNIKMKDEIHQATAQWWEAKWNAKY